MHVRVTFFVNFFFHTFCGDWEAEEEFEENYVRDDEYCEEGVHHFACTYFHRF